MDWRLDFKFMFACVYDRFRLRVFKLQGRYQTSGSIYLRNLSFSGGSDLHRLLGNLGLSNAGCGLHG